MILSWKEFLLSHADNTEYNKISDEIQMLIDPKNTAENNFRTLMEHPTLILISKGCSGKDIQASFYHTIHKTKLIGGENENIALLGFGSRACPMKIDIKDTFSITKIKKHPSFEQIMQCRSYDDIQNLNPNSIDMKTGDLEAHALLPPFLTKVLLDLEEFDAQNILLAFIKAIVKQKWLLFPSDSDVESIHSDKSNTATEFENLKPNELDDIRNSSKLAPEPMRTRKASAKKDDVSDPFTIEEKSNKKSKKKMMRIL